MLSLEQIRPFSPHANAAVERLTFRLCPLYILGFASGVGATKLVIFTIIGNAFLYAAGLCLFALLFSPFRRKAASG